MAPHWHDLGIELFDEKHDSMLDVIKAECGNDKRECCKEMFWYWLRTHPNATWQQLINSLRSSAVQLDTVASNIEKMCCTGKY